MLDHGMAYLCGQGATGAPKLWLEREESGTQTTSYPVCAAFPGVGAGRVLLSTPVVVKERYRCRNTG
jgi:hypothetical protein